LQGVELPVNRIQLAPAMEADCSDPALCLPVAHLDPQSGGHPNILPPHSDITESLSGWAL
jgi:hypothetical protein